MGASHTTLTSTGVADEGVPDLEGEFGVYAVDQHLFPGSGRMMRTFRLKHKQNSSTVVLKSMWVLQEHAEEIQEHQQELERIHKALEGQTHVAPFLYWSVGEYRQKNLQTVRPIQLLRPHMYTTLSDRLASRPFLTHVEKLWIAYQLLQALEAMHAKQVVHGFLTTENIGLSSWNWVVLVDVASHKARTALPDDDPSEYLYYFQELYKHGTDTTPREKRCYLAPERFYTPNHDDDGDPSPKSPLTPAMDIFSAGCVLMETFLNGERALDLGDLMEYRKRKSSQSLQQKLNKIEFSAMRAACKHMLHLDPAERLSANAYLERLQVSELIPESFATLGPIMQRVTYSAPDARLAIAAAHYASVLWETMGVNDKEGTQYVEKILGPTMTQMENEDRVSKAESGHKEEADADAEPKEEENNESSEIPSPSDNLFAETEALLKRLEDLKFDEDEVMSIASKDSSTITPVAAKSSPAEEDAMKKKSPMAQSSLLVYLQLILSTVRHVQRPASKLVALQLMERLGRYASDEARLQRIVPVTVLLLQDQDPLVRASAIQVLVATVSIIETFPPSDSNVFPQYIFKRVTHMIADPSLIVRLAFARSVAVLAETSHRFLDIAHAVRLYEAVGGGSAGTSTPSDSAKEKSAFAKNVFTDDVTKLLDDSAGPTRKPMHLESGDSGIDSITSDGVSAAGKTLISSTYNFELAALQETVSRWVVHIATDQSEHSSPAKRALLGDLPRLCNFFGLDGVMAFILPQILSFLNDRKDWQLRASLFESLPSVCHIIGRAATEHFVLPCLETALVDGEERVVSCALRCLSEVLELGLLSRSALIGSVTSGSTDSTPGFLKKYGALLVHPSAEVRHSAIETVNASCLALGFPDGEVFVVPILRPFFRFQPSSYHLSTHDGMEMCLHPAWTHQRFHEELDKFLAAKSSLSPTFGQWTSVDFQMRDTEGGNNTSAASSDQEHIKGTASVSGSASEIDLQTEQVRLYLQMLARSRTSASNVNPEEIQLKLQLDNVIEGSLKLAQNIKFPRQDVAGLPAVTLPAWYSTLRDIQEDKTGVASESAAIRSVSALGQVYGLSIMDQSVETSSKATDIAVDEARKILKSKESKSIEAACTGEWGSETCLDPTLTDTSLLVTKLNALQVPPLPPRLGEEKAPPQRVSSLPRGAGKDGSATSASDLKPKIDTMVASSSSSPGLGHTAPVVRISVSHDQRFFVTGSHDGTCRVWETEKAEKCSGVLESSIAYEGHCVDNNEGAPRINDLAMVESGHSVVSGASDGSVHVWRVDLVSSSSKQSSASTNNDPTAYQRSRVAGSSEIRRLDPAEGEILAVNHYNSTAASVLMFASQKGYVHSWDLRCATEPFALKNAQGTGYLTSMALGSDRNWVVTGTSRGFLALWDLRFQQVVKLWKHSRGAPINRLATSFVPPPQSWLGRGGSNAEAKPFIFAASGPNECGMFDIIDGSCRECFRTVDYGSRYSDSHLDEIPRLDEVPVSSPSRRKFLSTQQLGNRLGNVIPSSFLSINAMVGSIGPSDSSFLITGGSDSRIRYWDFILPSKCYVSSGLEYVQPRPSFERIDYDQSCRLMLCRQTPSPTLGEVESSRVPRKLFQGLKKPDNHHTDSIQDLKIVKSGLVSCSRDCTVKLWR